MLTRFGKPVGTTITLRPLASVFSVALNGSTLAEAAPVWPSGLRVAVCTDTNAPINNGTTARLNRTARIALPPVLASWAQLPGADRLTPPHQGRAEGAERAVKRSTQGTLRRRGPPSLN